MAKKEKIEKMEETNTVVETKKIPNTTDLEWTDYVLSLLSDDEKINGNPTTDGLRRIFEIALNCRVVASTSNVVQSPLAIERLLIKQSMFDHVNRFSMIFNASVSRYLDVA